MTASYRFADNTGSFAGCASFLPRGSTQLAAKQRAKQRLVHRPDSQLLLRRLVCANAQWTPQAMLTPQPLGSRIGDSLMFMFSQTPTGVGANIQPNFYGMYMPMLCDAPGLIDYQVDKKVSMVSC